MDVGDGVELQRQTSIFRSQGFVNWLVHGWFPLKLHFINAAVPFLFPLELL